MKTATKYLGYYEVLEASNFQLYDTLEEAKAPWCFTMRIFEVGEDFTEQHIKNMPKPRFQKICGLYDLIYSEGNLIHEIEYQENAEK